MMDGQCCEWGNLSSMHLSGRGSHLWNMENARSIVGMGVPLHKLKLCVSFGSYRCFASALEAQSHSVSPSCVV